MKFEIRGWKRETTLHLHPATPLIEKGSGYYLDEVGNALTWNANHSAFVKIENVALNGAFMVQMKFEQKDLESWLAQFVKSEPEKAIKLLSRLQGQATVNLCKSIAESLKGED